MTFIPYAQNFEDAILWRTLQHIEKGFYVDVGANDPNLGSGTFASYKKNWNGINIERSGDVLSLNTIFEEFVRGPIHFLRIDAKGNHKAVLDGLNLRQWRPWIILIKSNPSNSTEESQPAWEQRILEHGYQFTYYDELNRFYVANEHKNLMSEPLVPANNLDKIDLPQAELSKLKDQVDRQNLWLNTAHEKNYALISELTTAHHQNYNLIDELMKAQKSILSLSSKLNNSNDKVSHLNSELGIANNKVIHLSSEISESRSQISRLSAELNNVWNELNKIHQSRLIRYTRPFRTFGDHLRRNSQQSRLKNEEIVHKWIIHLKQYSWYIKYKLFLKNHFSNSWLYLRSVLLPSYSQTPPMNNSKGLKGANENASAQSDISEYKYFSALFGRLIEKS